MLSAMDREYKIGMKINLIRFTLSWLLGADEEVTIGPQSAFMVSE